ncbi:facilitated trehalose transporter Tret1 [Fopius arisanus]|uniref:Facilitated trehalose transporter Tret1 n=2 Tax=Fopius arisanus TaxID=64838 RepID=A0A0C9R6D5_9HYME|nr:PREDICTED: facilitated trehalose transporter Tret1-like [Fopius arisanus]
MEVHNKDTKQWPQYLAAITATISLAITGSHIGWTSPSLPYLKSNTSSIPLSSDDASWIASFYLLGTIPGSLLAALIVDRYGRKTSLLLSGLPLLAGWVLIIIAWNPYVLYASRFISGVGQGVVYVVCPMYIGEIADKNIRGTLGSFIKLMVTSGELYAHAIGPFVPYDYLAYSCAIIPLLFFITFAFMPESPYYLMMKNDRSGAARNLQLLKQYDCRNLQPGETHEVLEEDLDQIAKTVINDMTNRGHFWDLFDTKGNRKAVIISFGLQIVLQFSGLAAIESYTQEIIGESDSGLSPGIVVIILSVVQLMAGIGAAVLVDRLGRRPLLLITTFFSGVSLTVAGIFYFLKFYLGMEKELRDIGWALDVSVISYELSVALGLSPLSYMMLGELFPTNVKGIAVSLASLWASLLAFIVSKMHQVITDNWGIYTSLGGFAASCFVGIIFILFWVPETKGKSLFEIQEELNCSKAERNKRREKAANIDEGVFSEMHVSSVF